MLKKISLLFSFLTIITTTNAQVVYTPLYSNVYEFLERMSIKQIIKLDDEVKPYSRTYITSLLKEIDTKQQESMLMSLIFRMRKDGTYTAITTLFFR